MNIYVYNLATQLNDKELENLFSAYGEVLSVQIEKDKETGRSLSIAYIHMPIEIQAEQAVATLHGLEIYGRKIFVQQEGPSNSIQRFT